MWWLQGQIKDFPHVFLPCCMTDSLHRFLDFIAGLDWKNLMSLAFMLEYFYFQFMRGQDLWENLWVHDLHSTVGFLREFQLWLMQVIYTFSWSCPRTAGTWSEGLCCMRSLDMAEFLICLSLVIVSNHWVLLETLPHFMNPDTWEYPQYIECLVS